MRDELSEQTMKSFVEIFFVDSAVHIGKSVREDSIEK